MPPDPIHAAIADHRQAWNAFQVAPEGEDTILANDAMSEALDALLAASCATRPGARALLAHLRWWLAEEAEFAAGYQPAYGRAEARAAELAMLLGAPASGSGGADPIHAVLDAANTAETEHTLACEALDETDDASMRGCNAACERASVARHAMMRTLPATLGGLRALACHYVRWGEAWADDGFLHIARSLAGCEPRLGLTPGSDR
ncbi:hypothetical protein [Methylobacterium gossipiicola]|uniref:Uncharacterized protein n=1 Tax=Methylobacterium gossipiicola TaxID=582675 RepID=A0A1I2WW45_9HYPH|nr:hypothetical protein [Methylobacterium gossipiicola]SFH04839.1 hypothetical protein SAMN05192565_12738 [Methylobacterium gossipiicola]